MEYVQLNDKNLKTEYRLLQDWNPDIEKASEIRGHFQLSNVEKTTASSRSEWPKKRTTGIKTQVGSTEIEIRKEQIRIKTQNLNGEVINTLDSVFSESTLNKPDANEFRVSSVSYFVESPKHELYIDFSKCKGSGENTGHIVIYGLTVDLYANGWAMVGFREPTPMSKASAILSQIDKRDIIYKK